MAITGVLIAESLRSGARLEGVTLTVRRIARDDDGDPDAGQPLTWTFIEFEAPLDEAEELAAGLSRALDKRLGWYCDFRSPTETFVVFAERVFRYQRGDKGGRSEAEAHARSMGVPESQLDWPE
jgi:hypothetical protein